MALYDAAKRSDTMFDVMMRHKQGQLARDQEMAAMKKQEETAAWDDMAKREMHGEDLKDREFQRKAKLAELEGQGYAMKGEELPQDYSDPKLQETAQAHYTAAQGRGTATPFERSMMARRSALTEIGKDKGALAWQEHQRKQVKDTLDNAVGWERLRLYGDRTEKYAATRRNYANAVRNAGLSKEIASQLFTVYTDASQMERFYAKELRALQQKYLDTRKPQELADMARENTKIYQQAALDGLREVYGDLGKSLRHLEPDGFGVGSGTPGAGAPAAQGDLGAQFREFLKTQSTSPTE